MAIDVYCYSSPLLRITVAAYQSEGMKSRSRITAGCGHMDCISKPVKSVRGSFHPGCGDSCQPPGKRRVVFIVAIPISGQNQWKNVNVGVIEPQRRTC